MLEKVGDGLVSKTNGTASSQGFSKSAFGVDAGHFLFFRGGIAPDAIGRHLLILIVFVFVGRVDAGDAGDTEHVLDAGAIGNGSRNAAVDAKDVLIDDGGQR